MLLQGGEEGVDGAAVGAHSQCCCRADAGRFWGCLARAHGHRLQAHGRRSKGAAGAQGRGMFACMRHARMQAAQGRARPGARAARAACRSHSRAVDGAHAVGDDDAVGALQLAGYGCARAGERREGECVERGGRRSGQPAAGVTSSGSCQRRCARRATGLHRACSWPQVAAAGSRALSCDTPGVQCAPAWPAWQVGLDGRSGPSRRGRGRWRRLASPRLPPAG